MAQPFQLRPAQPSDLPSLLALESVFPGDRLSWRQLRRHQASARNLFRVVDENARVLGYALTLLRRGSREARLYSLVVDPAERGRGLAWALLQDAETQAALHGCTRLRLEVRADNAPAIALYRRAGYVERTPREGYYEDGATALRFEHDLA